MPEKLLLKIPVIAEALTWMTVLGSIQLALRHPENQGPSAKIARQFARQLADKLLEEGILSTEEIALMLRDEMRSANRRTP
jgi:hypothetical protein